MDRKRAKEIIESHGVIQVLYKGIPVWIEQIDQNNDSAEITLLDREERKEVPIAELYELNSF